MKALAMIGVAALASLTMVAQASASSFAPVSTNFQGTGKTELKKGSLTVQCWAVFNGQTDAAGAAKITSATFSSANGGSILCGGITATALPWLVSAPSSPTTATINNVSVSASIFGTCTGNVPLTLVAGAINFNTTLSPDCAVRSVTDIVTNPTVSIVP